MNKINIKDYIGKIIAVYNSHHQEGELCILLGIDNYFIYVLNCRNIKLAFHLFNISEIALDLDEADIEKFKEYASKASQDKDFRGDSDIDKGYKIYKKIKK